MVNLAFYKPNGQWNLVVPVMFNLSTRRLDGFSDYDEKILHLQIERRPKFFFYFLIVPVFAPYLLLLSVWLIPVESGEKISMSLTLLLAQIVSTGLMLEFFPPSSTNFPHVGYFVVTSIFQMGIKTIIAVFG